MKISHVVIPAAGLGTRFLPYTKAVPKEMLPIGNIPAIQFIIQEALQSDISHACIIANKDKEAIGHYFSKDEKLEKLLASTNKLHLLDSLYEILDKMNFSYVEQPNPLGLGHAIWMTQKTVGSNNYFGVMLPDDLIINPTRPGLGQLINVAQNKKATVIAVQEVGPKDISAYGVIEIESQLDDSLFKVKNLVEKPKAENAPSNLGIIGRYVLSPLIFNSIEYLANQPRNGELQLTDAIAHLLHHTNEPVYAVKLQGTRYDIGTPAGWERAIVQLSTNKII